MKIQVVKHGGFIKPIDDEGRDALRRFANGEIFMADVTMPRNLMFHRKFFAMLKIILENQEYYTNVNDLRAVCLCEIGHCDTIRTKNGYVSVPKSISWAQMDEIEFNKMYDKAVEWVTTVVIPGFAEKDVDEMVILELHNF